MDKFILPIGYYKNGVPVKSLDIASISGNAEKIFTTKPKRGKLYNWFGHIVAAAVDNIAGIPVSAPFLQKNLTDYVPDEVLEIPLVDVGSLLIQVQRACWEDHIPNQRVRCIHCSHTHQNVNLDLNRIEIPQGDATPPKSFEIMFDTPVRLSFPGSEIMAPFEGLMYNGITVRVPTLKDGLDAQKLVKNAGEEKGEIDFWREVTLNCIENFFYHDGVNARVMLPDGFLNLRSRMLFTKDWSTKMNRHVRKMMQTTLPSAVFYYQDECDGCGELTPFYTNPASFFTS